MRWASAHLGRRSAGRFPDRSTPAWVVGGFALGALAGWVIAEWTGGVSRERVSGLVDRWRRDPPDPDAPASPRDRVRAALDTDPDLRALDLGLIPAGRMALELHGWVPSRRLRSRATRLAATAAGAIRLIDCLLVRGEDDRPADDGDADAFRSA